MKILFIGAGSIAEAMIQGIVQAPNLNKLDIWVTNCSNRERLDTLQHKYSVQISYDLRALLSGADVIILAMKTKDARGAMQDIHQYITEDQLVISVLAGLSLQFINRMLGETIAIARAMPNTSATIQQSATGLSFNEYVTTQQQGIVRSIFSSIGTVTVVDEQQLDLVTGLSGSGPAYVYYVAEAMEQAAVELGLPAEEAKRFILQTLTGASKMLEATNKPPCVLRQAITSAGGTTEAGIKKLDQYHAKEAFKACIKEATEHSGRLRSQFEHNEPSD